MSPEIVFEIIPFGAEQWEVLAPVWADLLEATGHPSAFLSETWVGRWLEAFGAGLRPEAWIWRDGVGAPVGCALVSRVSERVGPVRMERLFVNASGAGRAASEHNDILAKPSFREAVLDDLVARARATDVDELELVGMVKECAMELMSRWGSHPRVGYFGEAPYVDLERVRSDGGVYLDHLSSNTRSQVRRSIRLYADRFGPMSLEVAGPDQAPSWFVQMVELHQERWEERGEPGAFGDDGTLGFHGALMARAVGEPSPTRLAIDLIRIRFGNEDIAFLYCLRHRNRVSFYQSGFRYHEDKRLKPGLVAHALAVQHYAEAGAEEYDFLGGEVQSVRYKRSLATDVRELAWLRLPAATLKMRVLGRAWRLRRRLSPGHS